MRFFHFQKDKWILGYLWNQLSPSAREAFERHLEGCSACRAQLEKEKNLESLLHETGEYMAPEKEGLDDLKAKIGPLPPYEYVEIKEKSSKTPLYRQFAFQSVAVMAVMAVVALLIWMGIPRIEPVKVDKLVGKGLLITSINTGETKPYNRGDRLYRGDILRTQPGTRAVLKVGNLGTVWVQQGTQLVFLGQENSEFSVDSGEIWVQVDRHGNPFRVQTPMGKVSVMGTEFRILITEGYLTVACLKSKVKLENEYGNVIINQGWKSYAKPGMAPKDPVKVSGGNDWRNQVDYYGKQNPEQQNLSYLQLMESACNYYCKGDYEGAWKCYAWAAVLKSNSSRAWWGMGYSSAQLYNYQRSRNEFIHSYKLNPASFKDDWLPSSVLLNYGEYDLINKLMEHRTQRDPGYHGGWLILGEVNMLEGKYQEADACFNRAWETGIKDCEACYLRYNVSRAYMAALKGDMAKLDEYKRNWPKDINVYSFDWALVARTYQRLGSIQGERSAWYKYMEKNPQGPFAKEARARLDKLENM